VNKRPLILFSLALAAALSLSACQDTKDRQENEQLKAHVLDLQKQLGDMGNRVDEASKARDDLTKENAALRQENDRLKARSGKKKAAKPRRRRRVNAHLAAPPWPGQSQRC
jgi:regulator of replication initiation timing